jgi:predicted amidohydrolase
LKSIDDDGAQLMDASVRVAAVQLTSGTDTKRNVDVAADLVATAAGEGATYVQLPEYFNYLGPQSKNVDVAESIPGPTTERFAQLARSCATAIHLGSMLELAPVAGKCYNTSVVLDANGAIVATYRKAHLFDIDVPGAALQRESDAIVAGDELVIADVAGLTLGLSVCFDLRFPELYRQLAVHGATVLAIPAAFNALTGRAHWDVLLRARAIENHAFVVAAAQVGTTAEGVATYGHSMIVGPWGDVIAESTADGDDVVLATLDLNDVVRRRQQIDVLTLRRPDVYDSLDDTDEVEPER